MAGELVSIIVPAYNHEAYVVECLHSIHAQTHDRLELIFIDDCSPDRTFRYAQSLLATPFGRRFENVVLRRKDRNSGAPDSLNLGLESATGRYVAIINSDDLFRGPRIEALLGALATAASELAFSAVEPFTETGWPADGSEADADIPVELQAMTLQQHLNVARDVTVGFALLRRNVAISTGNFLMTMELARRVGGFASLQYCHDWDFILQSLLFCEPVFVPETLYDYRLHPRNSFRSYKNIAGIETQVVLRRFFAAVARCRRPSPLCPSPVNWPGYFEAFIEAAGFREAWLATTGGTRPGWRTRKAGSTTANPSAVSALRAIGLQETPPRGGAADRCQ
ncbi:MAG: glycosyltransferase family 2 protein [Planctomycetia bacterium]|nr:glycosyltransferase family 2 protein [Planctomycetia bacterium]